jgi:hypothetical protein
LLSQTIPSQLHDIWKIQVVVRDIRLGFRAYLIIDDLFMVLPFTVNADGSVVSEYTYLSHEQRTRNISIHVYNLMSRTTTCIFQMSCNWLGIVCDQTNSSLGMSVISWCSIVPNLVHNNDSGGVASIYNERDITIALSCPVLSFAFSNHISQHLTQFSFHGTDLMMSIPLLIHTA